MAFPFMLIVSCQVPAPTMITSPSDAPSTAPWIVVTSPGTWIVAAESEGPLPNTARTVRIIDGLDLRLMCMNLLRLPVWSDKNTLARLRIVGAAKSCFEDLRTPLVRLGGAVCSGGVTDMPFKSLQAVKKRKNRPARPLEAIDLTYPVRPGGPPRRASLIHRGRIHKEKIMTTRISRTPPPAWNTACKQRFPWIRASCWNAAFSGYLEGPHRLLLCQ